MNPAGKRVLVTGGAVRIGAAIVRAFANAGAQVLIHCRNSSDAAEQLLSEIGGEKNGHRVLVRDLTSPGAPESLIAESGGTDMLVNNAAVYERIPFREETPERMRAGFDVNFFAPFALMQAFAASRAGKDGESAVVNLLDQAIAGNTPEPFGYLLSKKMLAEATKAAALVYAPAVRVNAIAPGPVFAPQGMESSGMRETLRRVPLGKRIPPENVAEAALFLVRTSSLTGEILYLDGGQHLFETARRREKGQL